MSKFASAMDRILYTMTLDGIDDMRSYIDGSSVTLLLGIVPPGAPFTDWTPQRLAEMTTGERLEARYLRAAVIHERSDGIVEVRRFKVGEEGEAQRVFDSYPDDEPDPEMATEMD